jgi:hypothetical protein
VSAKEWVLAPVSETVQVQASAQGLASEPVQASVSEPEMAQALAQALAPVSVSVQELA